MFGKITKETSRILAREHENILKVVDALNNECRLIEQGEEIDEDFFKNSIDFIRNYADKFHHAKEEDILFKEFNKQAEENQEFHCNPVEQMLVEHDEGRKFVKGMEEALEKSDRKGLIENGRSYINLIREHIFKEDNILYPMADESINEIIEEEMLKKFKKIKEENNFNEVSWYQENPKTSIDLILSANPDKDANIIDVGGGDSKLVDKLLEQGFKNLSVLDISLKALEKSKQRFGEEAKRVKWIESDLREFDTGERYDIWHDRAVFHFLTSEKDINKYAEIVNKLIKPEGYLIIASFSLKGPEKCSGLDVKRYSKDSIKEIFNKNFKHIRSFEETHKTPFQTTQSFIYNIFKKIK